MTDDSVQNLLRTLAEADASAEAPPEIEVRLRKEFRSRRQRRRWRQAAVWAASAAAAIILVLIPSRKSTVAPINAVEVNAHVTTRQNNPAPLAGQTTTMPSPGRIAVRPRQQMEIATEFFPLMVPGPPFERGHLLRVELPASAMQMVGLPVHEEHLADLVQADVLLGEEGLPRAIRFVKFETK